MKEIPEDWSRYLRESIDERIRREERKEALKKIDRIMKGAPRPSKKDRGEEYPGRSEL